MYYVPLLTIVFQDWDYSVQFASIELFFQTFLGNNITLLIRSIYTNFVPRDEELFMQFH